MIKTTTMLKEELKDYKAPNNKIMHMVKNNELFPIVRGLYETDRNTAGYLLAASIYNPSYLSFDYALSFYGLIPEAVYTFTSATFKKNRKRKFQTAFGTFIYRDIPADVYPLGIKILYEGDYSFLISEAEKAICDKLYTLSPVGNIKELEYVLFSDLRIDENEFDKLDKEKMIKYAGFYKSTNLNVLIKWLRRNK